MQMSRVTDPAQELQPKAQSVYSNTDLDTFESWRRVWLKHRKLSSLGAALVRFGALCGCTTSGVEQAFGKQFQLFGKQRQNLNHHTENDENALYLDEDLPGVSDKKLCARAALIWLKLRYEKKRAAETAPRMTVKKKADKKSSCALSVAAWRRAARGKLAAAVQARGLTQTETLERGLNFPRDHAGWTSAHDSEKAFQEQKRHQKKMEASENMALLPREEQEIAADRHHWQRLKSEQLHRENLKLERQRKLDMTAAKRWRLAEIVRGQVSRPSLGPLYVCLLIF
jgi:hypothetical protein